MGNIVSLKSHIDAKLSHLYDRFFQFPFQFYSEHEIHYWYAEFLNNLRKNDQRYRNLRIIREFPTTTRFSRNPDTGLIYEDKNIGRRHHIGLVVEQKDVGRFGYEFYFGKVIQVAETEFNGNLYFLPKRNWSERVFRQHTMNDIFKLEHEPELDFSYVLIFIATLHENLEKREYFIKKSRREIRKLLKNFQRTISKNIKIIYCEKGYTRDFYHPNRTEKYVISNKEEEDPFYSQHGDVDILFELN